MPHLRAQGCACIFLAEPEKSTLASSWKPLAKSQTGTIQAQGTAHALGSSKPVSAVLCYCIPTVGAVEVVFKERLENNLAKCMPQTSASSAPEGALGWGYVESARAELGVALKKQSEELHFNRAGIQETMETLTFISLLQDIMAVGVR